MTEARPMKGPYRARRRMTFARGSLYAFMLLAAASWAFIVFWDAEGFSGLFAAGSWGNGVRFLESLIGLDSDTAPAYLEAGRWLETGKLAAETLAMSLLAIGIAGAGAFATLLMAARNVSDGTLGGRPSNAGRIAYHLTRGSYTFSRGVPELVLAMIIVFFLSPGILPGAVALGLHNYGIVGRLTAEVVENLDPAPARALRASGAGNMQVLLYGILPQAVPQFITYLLYRWEVIIRTTVVVGFVTAGGLGREFTLRLSWFHYTDVTLLIIWYLLLVAGVDLLSAYLRRVARAE